MIDKLKPKSEFTKNVLTLMTGTTIAQAIPIAVSPILTRLYTPKDFGVFALYLSITTILGTIAAGRYDLAIMLPREDEDAVNIVALAFIIVVSVSLFTLLIVVFFHSNIVRFLNNKEISPWLYFIPFSVFLMGIFNILNYWNNRKKYYKDLAVANVLRGAGLSATQLTLGAFKAGAGGLISGHILGQVVANSRLILNILTFKNILIKISKVRIISSMKEYKLFPMYTLWASLANALSYHLINILISLFYSTTILGYYNLVQRVLGVSINLIGRSMQQVFFEEATRERNVYGTAINTFNRVLKKLIIIGLPLFVFLFFISKSAFIIVFGREWEIAGTYAKALVPLFFVRFIVAPLTVMNQINEKNKLGMVWQLGLLILFLIIFVTGSFLKIKFIIILWTITLIISLYYIFFLYLIWRHTYYSKSKNE